MLSQFQDLVLPVLLAGVIGLLIGRWLASRPKRQRSPAGTAADIATTTATATPRPARAPWRDAASLPPKVPASRAPAQPVLPQMADLLLVDDSAVARAKLRRLFEPAGYAVQLASDGVEALALLQKGRYAMMITDLEMPNMDGVTLINTCLRQPQTAQMPILAISGHDSLRAKFNECRDVCGVHRKPWVDDILLSHVATLVGARRARAVAVGG